MKIKCPLCDFENEESAKFCSNCNVPLIKPEAFDIKENPYIKKENKKLCENCGKKLSFFTSETLCKECKIAYESELSKVEKEILAIKKVTEQQLELLKKQDEQSLLKLYSRLYGQFETDKELEEQEIETLQKIQKALSLTNEDIKFDERIRPYLYVYIIKKEGKLPLVDLHTEGIGQVILKKDEIVHFANAAVLKELKTVSLGYSGGSYGISFPIVKGIRYRVGAHSGHMVKEDRLVETSPGALLITTQRLFLHPFPGHKPVSIPLNKILSYQCFDNGIEIYKEGREKGYFFAIGKSSPVEIFGLCLGHLLGR
jgi:RNase P subunit RPR2